MILGIFAIQHCNNFLYAGFRLCVIGWDAGLWLIPHVDVKTTQLSTSVAPPWWPNTSLAATKVLFTEQHPQHRLIGVMYSIVQNLHTHHCKHKINQHMPSANGADSPILSDGLLSEYLPAKGSFLIKLSHRLSIVNVKFTSSLSV